MPTLSNLDPHLLRQSMKVKTKDFKGQWIYGGIVGYTLENNSMIDIYWFKSKSTTRDAQCACDYIYCTTEEEFEAWEQQQPSLKQKSDKDHAGMIHNPVTGKWSWF